jgi:hypothetical protein
VVGAVKLKFGMSAPDCCGCPDDSPAAFDLLVRYGPDPDDRKHRILSITP